MKKIIITITGLVVTAIAPMIPTDMTLKYSYAFDYQPVEIITTATSTQNSIEYPFDDSDGDGKGYASVFEDNNGNEVIVEITEQQYKKMGEKDGVLFNTKKDQYLSIVDKLKPVEVKAAVAFDAVSAVAATTATSLTYSHTTSGSDRYLTVCYHGTNGVSDLITGITYNAVSMTQIGSSIQVPSDRWIGCYYLIAPATGANNVVVSASGSDAIRSEAISYTGANQSSQPDSSNSGTNTANTGLSLSTTVVANNSWTVMFSKDATGGITYGGETMRLNADAGGHAIADSNAAVAAGSRSLTITSGTSSNHAGIIFSIAPTGTCTYSGTGNWEINLGDDCYVTASTYVSGDLILYDNTGTGCLNIIDGAVLSIDSINATSTRTYICLETDDGSQLQINKPRT